MTDPTIVGPDYRIPKALWHVPILAICLMGFQALIAAIGSADFATAPLAPRAFVWTILVLWLGASALVVLNFLWIILGHYIVQVQGGTLTIRTLIGRVPLFKTKIYEVDKIRDMTVEKRRHVGKGHTWFRFAITCDYSGLRTTVLDNLSEERAWEVLNGPFRQFTSKDPR